MDADGIWGFRIRNAMGLLASLGRSHLATERSAHSALINARLKPRSDRAPEVDDGEAFDYEESRGD